MSPRAPKQWSLTKQKTKTLCEAKRQSSVHSFPHRGLQDDPEIVPQASHRTAQQKCTHLKLMLGQIVNYCPVISRNTIIKNSTSMISIWQAIHLHFGFQPTSAFFLDFNNISLAPCWVPRGSPSTSDVFIEDNLLLVNGNISHHGEVPCSHQSTPHK